MASAALVALAAATCSSTPENATATSGPGGASTSTVSGGGKGNGEGGLFNASTGAGGGAAPTSLCTGDLRGVLDETGKLVMTCPPDQGCLEGKCVAPCDAADGSHSTLGCTYYAIQAPMTGGDKGSSLRGGCFASVVVNQWPTPVTLSVSRAGTSFSAESVGRLLGTDGMGNLVYDPLPGGVLPPNQAAVLFLSRDPTLSNNTVACPAGTSPAISTDGAAEETGLGDAFQISTDRPVTAYSVFPWGGAPSYVPSATLLFPVSAWEKGYVAPGIADKYVVPKTSTFECHAFMMVAASQDDTHVTLVPTVDVVPGMVAGASANTPVTYDLARGQYLLITQIHNLGGSVIGADKPVGLWIGSDLFMVPANTPDADATTAMIPPLHALGSEYVGATFALTAPTPWQIVGVVDGTKLTYDPAPPAGAPTSIDARQVLEFDAQAEFTVKSQDANHPFFMAVYRRGDAPKAPSGPDYVPLLTPPQYRAQYVFATDPTYKTTTLVFIRKKGPSGFADVALDCVASITGWMPIGSAGIYEVARVGFGSGNDCKNGVREAHSDNPFGLTVWGWDFAASYGYPAGGNLAPVNNVEVPPVPK